MLVLGLTSTAMPAHTHDMPNTARKPKPRDCTYCDNEATTEYPTTMGPIPICTKCMAGFGIK